MNLNDRSRFDMAQQYLYVSINSLDAMLNETHSHMTFSNHNLSQNELYNAFRYKSVNTIIATLFCLYQGIELLLKGFLSFRNTVKTIHNSGDLLQSFLKLYKNEMRLKRLFIKFLREPRGFIKDYIEGNNIKDIKQLYESLRYADKIGKIQFVYNYDLLLYPKDQNSFFKQIKEISRDTNELLLFSVKLFRRLEDHKFNDYNRVILLRSKRKLNYFKKKRNNHAQ